MAIKRIDELCTIKGRIGFRGYTKKDLVSEGNGAITLSPANIKDNKLYFDKCSYISWYKYDESPEIQLEIGDIVYCKTASIGKLAIIEYLPEKATLNPQFIVLKNINCNRRFLYHALTSTNFFRQVEQIISGVAVPTVSQANFGNLVINVPALPEQQEIAAHLDSIQTAIDNKKQQIQQLDELVKSKFVEMFGDLNINSMNWAVVNFDDAAKIDGNMTKDYEKYADYPHIGIDSIMKNTGELIGYRTVKEDNVISGKYIFTDKHIIYSKIRPNLNKVALPTFEGLCSADSYPILVNSEKCNRYYLAYVMRSDFFLTYILAHASRAGMPKVNREQIRGFNFPLPPIELQNTFAEYVQKIDSAKSIIKNQLTDLKELLDSKMDEYFGE
ncbi:MAG: restriction endonuclease subunit S [bacterium]|nr:restriction endonuclease subunit S [bacterium]